MTQDRYSARVLQCKKQPEDPPLHCTTLHCTALHCTALNCTELHCTALHCTALPCTALHCTALHCTSLYCNTLHCTANRCPALECSVLALYLDLQLYFSQASTDRYKVRCRHCTMYLTLHSSSLKLCSATFDIKHSALAEHSVTILNCAIYCALYGTPLSGCIQV